MIIVADGGSTKCDWAIVNSIGQFEKISSEGFNPNLHSLERIETLIGSVFNESIYQNCEQIFYFGSGCSELDAVQKVEIAFEKFFKNTKIHVKHDLEGSALATCGNQKAFAAILGTGSNLCLWNGKSVQETGKHFGNGYILGDEGSGTHLGKILIRTALSDQLGQLSEPFFKQFGHRDEIMNQVYSSSSPNVYLASFTRFLSEFQNHEIIQKIIKEAFDTFIKTHILCFEDYKTIPLNFVGSVAFVFQKELMTICDNYGIQCQKIIKEPLSDLVHVIASEHKVWA